MLDLRAFPLTDNAKDKIRTAANNYYRLSGIMITGGPRFDSDGNMFLAVYVTQKQIVNSKILSGDELISRCAGIFDGHLPQGSKVQISVTSDDKQET